MSLQLELQIFEWLQSINLLTDGHQTPYSKIQLPQQISMRFYDGVYIGRILKQIINLKQDAYISQKLDAIKQNSTPANRLYNWNILCETIKKLGLNIEYSQKSKILNLYSGPILKIIQFLFQLSKSLPNHNSSKLSHKPTSNLENQSLQYTTNISQFLTLSLSTNLQLPPQQTLNLLDANNKYLSHLMVKGLKNSFQPIFALLSDISFHMERIVTILFSINQKQNVYFLLNAIKSALISKQPLIAQNCIEVLTLLHQTYQLNSMSLDSIASWIKQQGINTILLSIRRYPQLFNQLIGITFKFIQCQMFQYMQPEERSLLWHSPLQKLTFFFNLITTLPNQTLAQFSEIPTFKNWLNYIEASLKQLKQTSEMRVLLTLGGWLWKNMQQQIEKCQNGLVSQFMAFLQTCSSHQSYIVFNQSIVAMFYLMEELGTRKNHYAPRLYKILINCFATCTTLQRVNFISDNFTQTFLQLKSLPATPLLPSLITNISKQLSPQLLVLCKIIIEQNRINKDQFMKICQLLINIILHDITHAQLVFQFIFHHIFSINYLTLKEFLGKVMQNILKNFQVISSLISITFQNLIENYLNNEFNNNFNISENSLKSQIKNHFQLRNSLKIYMKCANYSEEIKKKLEPNLYATYIRVKNELKKQQQAQLLIPLLKLSVKNDEQMQQKLKQYKKEEHQQKPLQILPQDHRQDHQEDHQQQLNRPELVSCPDSSEQQNTIIENITNQPNNSSIINNDNQFNNNGATNSNIHQVAQSNASIAKPAILAIKDIQKVKQKLRNANILKKKQLKNQSLLQSQNNLLFSALKQKRIIQFCAKNMQNIEYRCLYDWNTAKQQDQTSIYGISPIKLLNLADQQQDMHLQDVNYTMKKYRKIWRFLFSKYSTFGSRNRDQMKHEQKINMAQLWKMLKDYQYTHLKKQQSQNIIKIINQSSSRRNDLQNLTYLGFQQYIIQICNYGYNKVGYKHIPPGSKIKMFVQHLKLMTIKSNGNIDLFSKPQQSYFQQVDVIRQFNKRLKQNPQYILPQGYKKTQLPQLAYQYQINTQKINKFSNPYMDILEVLDQIISSCPSLGFHITEPLTTKTYTTLAKPCLFTELQQKLKSHSQSKGYMYPKKQVPITSQKQLTQKKPMVFKQQFHPLVNFSLGIKLGIASSSIKYRYIAEEVAYWMDDMLHAIENGQQFVQNRAKRKIDNSIKKQKRISKQQLNQKLQNQQVKWQKRVSSVKTQLNQYKQKKKVLETKKKQQIIQQKILQIQQEQHKKKIRLKRHKNLQKYLKQKKQHEQSQKSKALQLKRHQQLQKKKKSSQYLKKKKQQFSLRQQQLHNIMHQSQKKLQQQSQQKKSFVKKLYLNILKKQEIILNQIDQSKAAFNSICSSKSIQDTFQYFQQPLKLLFNLLLKQDNWKISRTSSTTISLSTLQFFSHKFKIIPTLIPKNILLTIFKIETRNTTNTQGINFQIFIRILLRIIIKAKDMLNAFSQKDAHKQQLPILTTPKNKSLKDISSEQRNSQFPKSKSNASLKTLTDQYLFNANGVTSYTIQQFIKFLNLPNDKKSMEQRFKMLLQEKYYQPKNTFNKQPQKKIHLSNFQ